MLEGAAHEGENLIVAYQGKRPKRSRVWLFPAPTLAWTRSAIYRQWLLWVMTAVGNECMDSTRPLNTPAPAEVQRSTARNSTRDEDDFNRGSQAGKSYRPSGTPSPLRISSAASTHPLSSAGHLLPESLVALPTSKLHLQEQCVDNTSDAHKRGQGLVSHPPPLSPNASALTCRREYPQGRPGLQTAAPVSKRVVETKEAGLGHNPLACRHCLCRAFSSGTVASAMGPWA